MTEPRIITVTLNTAVDRVLRVDGLTLGGHVEAERLRRLPAGKGINVSRALARLGCSSLATGFVGRDEWGWFETFLHAPAEGHTEDRGADHGTGRITSRLIPVNGQTRENITLLDAATGCDTHLRERGFAVAESDWRALVDALRTLVRGIRPGVCVVFSGSLPPGVAADQVATLAHDLGEAKARVVVDTGGLALRALLDATPSMDSDPGLWLVKPNAAELAACLEVAPAHDLNGLADQAAALHGRLGGRSWIAATAGELGSVLLAPDGRHWRARPPKQRPRAVSSVGCGDCFLAGLLQGLVRPGAGDLDDVAWSDDAAASAVRWAMAAAIANTAGAGAADFDPAVVQGLAEDVEM